MAYEQEKQVAIATVTEAASLCEQVRRDRSGDAIKKHDRSPVTIADFGVQAVICRAIAKAFPTDSIVAEEDAALLRQPIMAERLEKVTTYVRELVPDATNEAVTTWIDRGKGDISSRYWTLDPIDGTKGFLRGDQYAIALALIEGGEVKVGVLGCPALSVSIAQSDGEKGVLFVAVRGQGTTLIALKSGYSHPINAANTQDAGNLRLAESIESGHGNPPLQRAVAQAVGLSVPPLQMDSQAKYAALACGQAALYLRFPWIQDPDYKENIWDHAAGAIVVEEVGGRVTDMDGKLLDFFCGVKLVNNRGIVASNGALHEHVLATLRRNDLHPATSISR